MSINETVEKYLGEDSIEKRVKQHNIALKYGKRGLLNSPPKGYIEDNQGRYVKKGEYKKLGDT